MGLIANFKFEDNLNDSLNNHKITLSGSAPTYTTGKMGQSIIGQNNRLITSIPDTTSDMSFSVWFRNPTNNVGSHAICGTRNGTTGWMVYRNSGETAGTYRVYFHYLTTTDTLSSYYAWPYYTGLNDGNWHHLVLTRSANGEMTMWKDGVRTHNYSKPANFGRWNINTYNLSLFGDGSGNYTSNIGVELDEFKYYDHILSDNEVLDLYRNKIIHLKVNPDGVINDASHNNILTTQLVNVNVIDDSKFGVKSFELRGSLGNSYVDFGVNNHFNTGDNAPFAVSAWVKPYGKRIRDIIACKDNRSAPHSFIIGLIDSGWMGAYTGSAWVSFNTTSSIIVNNWHHVVWSYNGTNLSCYLNGVLVGTAAYSYTNNPTHPFRIGGHGSGQDFDGLIDEYIVYNSAIDQQTVNELYSSRFINDSKGNVIVKSITETKQRGVIVDWSVWENGQTGSIGRFGRNGDIAENSRVMGLDPWGKEIVLWQATPDATSGADGGWNGTTFPIDRTKLYRFSVWIKRNLSGNGTSYLGCSSNVSVLNRNGLTSNGNPYFYYGSNMGATNEWVLIVGHIFPADSPSGGFHPESGRYKVDGTYLGGNISDFVWANTATTGGERTYLYYCTDINVRQWWCYPRVDIVDGTEPSLNELLSGHDSRSYNLYKSKGFSKQTGLEITDKTVYTPTLNEVGVIKNCVGWWKLDDNSQDFVNNSNGVDTNVLYSSGLKNGGAKFNATNSVINITDNPILRPPELTLSAWLKIERWEGVRQIFLVKWTGFTCEISGGRQPYFSVQTDLGRVDSPYGPVLNDNIWCHFVGTYTPGVGVSLFINGALVGTTASNGVITYDGNPLKIGQYTSSAYFIGTVDNVKLFNRVLSQEDINRLYSEQKGNNFTINKDTLFISNSVIENR
jgi:hypothetical protein